MYINTGNLRASINTHRVTNSKCLISCERMAFSFLKMYTTFLNNIIDTPTIIKLLSCCNTEIILFYTISRDKELNNICSKITCYPFSIQ